MLCLTQYRKEPILIADKEFKLLGYKMGAEASCVFLYDGMKSRIDLNQEMQIDDKVYVKFLGFFEGYRGHPGVKWGFTAPRSVKIFRSKLLKRKKDGKGG